jgi:molybdopterin-containing oxidoreductase family iron-sulfur binding subunit
MKMDRRTFLKLGGAMALGLAIDSSFRLYNLHAFSAVEKSTIGKSKWGMIIDVSKCADGCKECVDACKAENNVPTFDDPKTDINWIRIVSLKQEFPNAEKRFIPMLCNHCENPPCVQVCPTKASFVRKDGIVLIDEHRCIGCRYCMIACPYRARYFNFRDPKEGLKEEERNPDVPMRKEGVVEKCTFCVHRIDKGLEPACVEACNKLHEGAITFGDLNDPNSDVSKLVASSKVHQIRADLGTKPKVYYLGL